MKNTKTNINKFGILFLMCLIISVHSGPFAGALCPQCVLSCTTGFVYFPPVWYACMAACCGASLFTCFSNETRTMTPFGLKFLVEL